MWRPLRALYATVAVLRGLRFSVRHAEIDPLLREQFEQYGRAGVQIAYFHGQPLGAGTAAEIADAQRRWLLEKADEEERETSVMLVMEVAITVLVALEVLHSFVIEPAIWLVHQIW